MAKYAGLVGYATQKETRPGIWEKDIAERLMYGDVLNINHSRRGGEKVNEDITLSNIISLMASPEDVLNLEYVEYMGVKWKATSVEVQRPRIIVTLGGVWHG